MPSKTAPGTPKTPLTSDEFLAACFKSAKERIDVDFDKVAALTGMSKGGAANKFRDMMKKMGVAAQAPGTPKTSTKRKISVKGTATNGEEETDVNIASEGDGDAADTPETKKIRKSVAKKGIARPVKKAEKKTLSVAMVEDQDEAKDEQGDAAADKQAED